MLKTAGNSVSELWQQCLGLYGNSVEDCTLHIVVVKISVSNA